MARFKKIDIPMYRMELQVFVGSLKKFQATVEDWSKKNKAYEFVVQDIEDSLSTLKEYEASTYYNSAHRIFLVYLPSLSLKNWNLNNIVHELAHATFFILRDVGIEVDGVNNEVFAYLQGWLMEEVMAKNGWEEV